jgi:EAL and modified HD-GYP domain-containing signal transduction protein
VYAYIARQPIYNLNKEIRSYELLYRDARSGNVSIITDGDAATRNVLSEAMSLFGFSKLTNGHMAYIHFTKNLILNDFVRLADPKEVAVEVMADITIDAAVTRKLEELRKLGYTLVLEDYDGHGQYNSILPLINIVRVDFRRFGRDDQRRFARKLKKVPVTMLAEKIETQADFDAARDLGFLLFQGYYFEKPRLMNKQIPKLVDSPYGRLLNELLRPSVDFDVCAQMIQSDAAMTYLLLKRAGFQDNFGGNVLPDIRRMLIQMGQGELRRYALLLLARENNATASDEAIRQGCLRGLFIERMMERAGLDSADGFLLGMFSMLDRILDTPMERLVAGIDLNAEMKDALAGTAENGYTPWLQYIMLYEMSNPRLLLPEIPVEIPADEVSDLFMRCFSDADELVNNLG